MGSLERRLRALESDLLGDPADVLREVLRRLTDEELDRYHDALVTAEREGEWAEEDLPIFKRVEELFEEVEREPPYRIGTLMDDWNPHGDQPKKGAPQ